jgi:hypothetical protein
MSAAVERLSWHGDPRCAITFAELLFDFNGRLQERKQSALCARMCKEGAPP